MAYLFTIEQIELVRRLRKTGLSKELVWKAYEEMDRLDAELNTTSNDNHLNANQTPITAAKSPPIMAAIGGSSSLTSCHTLSQIDYHSNPMSSLDSCGKQLPSLSLPLNAKQNSQSFQSIGYSLAEKTTNPLSASHMDLTDDESTKESLSVIPVMQTSDSQSSQSLSVAVRPSMSMCLAEESHELNEFKRKGETVMLNEIKTFVNKYNIRQIMIAEMTKISQGYVSRFFRGEGQDMSEKSKNLIYLWYISCRNRPEILTQFCPQTIGERRTQLTEMGDLLPIRRDRFIFRREHLMVLDKYFKDNAYPDSATKEQIADECNACVERMTKRVLKERDKVTLSVVSNWFNNKRKEAKSKRLPLNQPGGGAGPPLLMANNALNNSFNFDTSIYSNHSNQSVEELETRPDLSILADFDGQESVDLTDDEDNDIDSHHSFSIDETNYLHKELKPNFTIKLEPTLS